MPYYQGTGLGCSVALLVGFQSKTTRASTISLYSSRSVDLGDPSWDMSLDDVFSESNNRICGHNLDLETTTQTFMLRVRSIPLCVSASVKHSSPWSCDESKHTSSYYCMSFCSHMSGCSTPIRSWSTSELRAAWHTEVHDVCVHSWNKRTREEMRRCRCYKEQRDETWGSQDPSHTGLSKYTTLLPDTLKPNGAMCAVMVIR